MFGTNNQGIVHMIPVVTGVNIGLRTGRVCDTESDAKSPGYTYVCCITHVHVIRLLHMIMIG